jgi:general secretion pathway protein F
MDTYRFEATTRKGNIVTDTIEAANERSAIDRIQDMGFFPIKVTRAVDNEGVLNRFLSTIQGRINEKDIMTFTYQLGVLLEAGFTLDRSLSILSDLTEKKKLKELLQDLMSQVRSGKSFSDALAKFPAVFPVFFVNMMKAGEAGGFIEDTIARMAVYLENSQALKEDVRSALIYPVLLSFVGGAAVIILLTFVVPQFSKIFIDMGETLPLPTVILITISNALIKSWWLLLILAFGGAAAIKKYVKTEKGRRYWDKLKFKLPLFGKLYKEAAVSRFARTFGTLLGSGVPILNALQIVKGTLGSDKIAEIISSVREATRKGRGIAEPLRNSEIFPPLAVHMVTVGEETGRLDEMLIKIADRFDSEVRTTVKRMLALLEPVLILIMGIAVGFIVIAMLTAIFSINELPF